MKLRYLTLLSGAAAFALSAQAQVALFSVNAGDDGFTGWTTSSGTSSGTFLGQAGNPAIGLNTLDASDNPVSWGLFASGGQSSQAIYDFGGTLAVGQTVSIGASIGFIGDGATVGFGLQNGSSTNRFEAYYIGADSVNAWKINRVGGQADITGVDTRFQDSSWSNGEYLEFAFTLLANDTFSFTVNGVSITNSDLDLAASDISQIRIFNANAGGTSDHDQFFNNLSVIPEPSAYGAIFGALALALVVARRRRA